MLKLEDRTVKYTAILGDLQHKLDVYKLFVNFGPIVEQHLSNRAQGEYLKLKYPELVPGKDPSGNDPSEHTLGTIFEFHYYTDPYFCGLYLNWLHNHVK
jgi:hypothetical protein